MFSPKLRQRIPSSHHLLLEDLCQIIDALEANSKEVSSFKPVTDKLKFYNSYIDFALAIYVEKFKQMYRCIAESLEREWYMVYAQSGRAILENAAVLSYYAGHKDFRHLREAWKSQSITDGSLTRAVDTIDRFVRGNRFSWDAFAEGRFDELGKRPHPEGLKPAHTQECLRQWYKDSPNAEQLYDLFCDLVHPNLGSNLLVVRSHHNELVAGGIGGSNVSIFIVCPTLAGLIRAYKRIQDDFLKLEALRIPI